MLEEESCAWYQVRERCYAQSLNESDLTMATWNGLANAATYPAKKLNRHYQGLVESQSFGGQDYGRRGEAPQNCAETSWVYAVNQSAAKLRFYPLQHWRAGPAGEPTERPHVTASRTRLGQIISQFLHSPMPVDKCQVCHLCTRIIPV